MTDHPQLTMFGGTSVANTMRRTTPRANRRAASAASTQAALPLVSKRFLPLAGVPKTRGDCPVQRPCPHVRCRHHLFLEEASTRAGRPGLSSVQRNERGLTVSQPGHVGNERAGTTVNPRWLTLRDEPAELERVCPAWMWFDENGTPEVNVDPLRWAHMRVKAGDALDVVNQVDSLRVTWAKVGNDNESVVFDEAPPRYETMFIWLVRQRRVQSCALDVIDTLGKQSNEDTGFHLSRHRTLVARINRVAVRKAAANAVKMGMDERDFKMTLIAMGEE